MLFDKSQAHFDWGDFFIKHIRAPPCFKSEERVQKQEENDMNSKYMIYVNNQPISVSAEVYKEYWKSIEHERYLTKQIRKTWIYLDHLFDEYENNTLEIQLIEDLDPTRNEALKMERYQELYKAINTLTDDEKDLVIALYFKELTQTEYAEQIGDSQQSISKKHNKIIKKLRNLIKF